MDTKDFTVAVAAERARQDARWGDQSGLPFSTWALILIEELAELSEELEEECQTLLVSGIRRNLVRYIEELARCALMPEVNNRSPVSWVLQQLRIGCGLAHHHASKETTKTEAVQVAAVCEAMGEAMGVGHV